MSDLTSSKIRNLIIKYLSLYIFSGSLYIVIELLYRQRTDVSMFWLSGFCGLFLAGLNNIYTYELDFSIQVVLSTFFTTTAEYVFGRVCNADYHIWDYRNLPFNVDGQIQLYFCGAWALLAIIGIPLLDYIDWKFFHYKRFTPPYYKLFGKKVFQFKMN